MGKCPDCGAWDALDQFTEPKLPKGATSPSSAADAWRSDDDAPERGSLAPSTQNAQPLPEIEVTSVRRHPTGIGEFDRVLGGGIVPGSVTLLGGDPGIGKSTLLMQAAGKLAENGQTVLYATSEESAVQSRLRAERLFGDALPNLDEFHVLADTNLNRIVEQARTLRPAVCVIDSIQMIYKPDVDASPGSATQLRRCCTELVYLAKVSGMAIILVGHVTKDGQLAGPRLLEHLVDTVLAFEGDAHHAHRVVRGLKNRFGTTQDVGLFEMAGDGLLELVDPGRLVDPMAMGRPGCVITPVMHGSRAIPVEIQALTATGFLGGAKRKASGLDTNRLSMIVAVLEQHAGLRLADQDIFVSAVGGLRVVEPAADLAILLAIAGAHLRRAIPGSVVVSGEVGLSGEVRPSTQTERRRRESGRLGYKSIVMARARRMGEGKDLSTPRFVSTVAEAVDLLENTKANSQEDTAPVVDSGM